MNPNQQTPSTPDPIDQVLNAFAQAAPPNGMESRILQALEARALIKPVTAPTRPIWLSWQPLCALASATVAILLITTHLHHHTSVVTAVNSPLPHLRDSLTVAQPGSPAIQVSVPAHDSPVPHLRPSFTGPKVGIGEADPPTALPSRQPARDGHIKSDLAEAAHSPSSPQPTLVSFPAPPMPLTAQEKLLLRIAHRDNPQTLTALTPEHFAAQQAQDVVAFQNFFPPPIPVEYPTLISQSNPPSPIHGDPK